VNFIQFFLFLLFVFSTLSIGLFIYNFVGGARQSRFLNRSIFLGESLLLGGICIVGLMMGLSLLGLYQSMMLWGVVLIGYGPMFNASVRRTLTVEIFKKPALNVWTVLTALLVCVFIFRNIYFMVDVDGTTNYLYTQKIWLERGSSLLMLRSDNYAVFLPQFDAVPYALGLSIFPGETFFPQLISTYWRIISVLLIFGYVSYRLSSLFGLGAAALFLFNDHIFYSGANHYVIINAALIALLVATGYGLWESRRTGSVFRLFLALIFCSQIPGNKYQMIYALPFLALLGVVVPGRLWRKLKLIFQRPRWLAVLVVAGGFVSLWFIKNYLITGNPVFPGLAGQLHSFGWTLPQQQAFARLFGGVSPAQFIKFATFFFIWPGMIVTKLLCIFLVLFPLILLWSRKLRRNWEIIKVEEISYWLCLSLFMLLAISLGSHTDPRYYRYAIGIFCVGAVISYAHIFEMVMPVRNRLASGLIIVMIGFSGARIAASQGGPFRRPTIRENLAVLLNKRHTADILPPRYPEVAKVEALAASDQDKFAESAYFVSAVSNFPLFFVPTRPVVGLYRTTVIDWDSYESVEKVKRDLEKNNIKWIMVWLGGERGLVFESVDEFAVRALGFDRNPQNIYSNYGMPGELL
jgi:hypothetical protein